MRALLARQVSTGRWCRRIDTGRKAAAAFRAEVAAEFGLAEADVAVVIETWTDQDYSENKATMNSGTFRTAAVIAPPKATLTLEQQRRAATTWKRAQVVAAFVNTGVTPLAVADRKLLVQMPLTTAEQDAMVTEWKAAGSP